MIIKTKNSQIPKTTPWIDILSDVTNHKIN